jgi:hypothetical protein
MGSVAHVSEVCAAPIFRIKVGTVSVHVYIGLSPTDPKRKGGGRCPVKNQQGQWTLMFTRAGLSYLCALTGPLVSFCLLSLLTWTKHQPHACVGQISVYR